MLKIRINDSEFNQDVKIKIASRALIIKDNKVAILYSKKYNAYITPGGGIENDETLEEACIRETKEETGLIVKPIKSTYLIKFKIKNQNIIMFSISILLLLIMYFTVI